MQFVMYLYNSYALASSYFTLNLVEDVGSGSGASGADDIVRLVASWMDMGFDVNLNVARLEMINLPRACNEAGGVTSHEAHAAGPVFEQGYPTLIQTGPAA